MLADNMPWWLIYLLGVVSGVLLLLAIGPASDAYWEAVYTVRRACTIVGAVILAAAAVGGVGYLIWHFGIAPS